MALSNSYITIFPIKYNEKRTPYYSRSSWRLIVEKNSLLNECLFKLFSETVIIWILILSRLTTILFNKSFLTHLITFSYKKKNYINWNSLRVEMWINGSKNYVYKKFNHKLLQIKIF